MKYPLLPRWVLTNPLPAFYEIESTTSVQMTAKLYKYIQGFTDDYNKFADEINKAISDHINEVNADQECFEAKITKIIHDYIITIDSKIAHQDREIQEAILYIKDNIVEGVTQVIEQMKESGELDEAIANSFNELGNRIVTLENSVNDLLTFKENAEERITNTEELINDQTFNIIQLGAIPNDSTKGLHNINVFKNVIDEGQIIDLAGKTFYIETTDPIIITKNLIIKNGKLIIGEKTTSSKIFNSTNRIDFKLENVEIENLVNGTIFYVYDLNPNIIKVSDCYFKGNFSLIRTSYISGESNPITDISIKQVIFTRNKCENTEMSFIKMNDTKYDYFEISNNEIHNFSNVFCHTGIDNNYEFGSTVSENMKELIVKENYAHNDIDYSPEITSSSYFCFILAEGNNCIYERNHVEGLHTTSNVTCVDGYFNTKKLYYRNNINKNNLAITQELNESYFLKAKGGEGGHKYCENNKFILEKDYATKLNIDPNYLRIGLLQATSNQSLYFRNNIVDAYSLVVTYSIANAQYKELEFVNNKISCYKTGKEYNVENNTNFININNSENVNISNNEFNIENSTGFNFIYCGDKTIKNLKINNNLINGNMLSFLTSVVSDLVICKENVVYSQTDTNKNIYPFFGLKCDKTIIEKNTIYQENGMNRINPFLYLLNNSLFNVKYIAPFKSAFSTESLTVIGSQTYYYEMIIKTKNKTYKGSWYIKGIVENEEQKIIVLPYNATEEKEVLSGEWVIIKLQDDDNLTEIIKPKIGGTNKVLAFDIQSGYIQGTILDIDLTIKTI